MFRGFADDNSVIAGLVDTHAAPGNVILLSPISLAEIVYLTEKNRLPISADEELRKALADHKYVIEEAPFTAEIVESMLRIPRGDVPDMPDRIVAATAFYFDVPVISRDRRIPASSVRTIW
jgi:PIN domain nuclease of toxin-antitoxin system